MMNETTPSPTAAASEDLEAASESRLRARVNGRRADALILALPDGGVAELPRGEFGARASAAAVGDTLDVFVLGERGSTALVSEAKADWLALWDRLLAAAGTDAPFEGEIVAEVKGGFVVDLGLRAFLPMSQAAARKGDTPTGLLFKRGRFQVIEFNAKRGTVVVSRRAEATAERGEARAEQLARLSVGDVVDGVVRRIVPYGAFLEVGAVEGLLHMKDIVWGRVENPAKALEVGQTVRVKVLEIESGGKVKLGLKQTQPDPWESVPSRYKGGQRVRGKVVSVAPFGAFLEVEPGVEGLLHVSEMSWTERVTDPAQFAPAGKHLEVVVLGVEPEGRRLSLGLRQTQENPWKTFAATHPAGSKVQGTVKAVDGQGVVVVVDGLEGWIHASDLRWGEEGLDLLHTYQPGATVEAVVLGVQPKAQRLTLGIKQLEADPWADFAGRHPVGSTLTATVKELQPNGAVLEIEPGYDAFCHVSQLSLDRIRTPAEAVKRGQRVEAQVTELDPDRRRLAVSVKALLQGDRDYRAYMKDKTGDATSSLAQALGPLAEKLKEKG